MRKTIVFLLALSAGMLLAQSKKAEPKAGKKAVAAGESGGSIYASQCKSCHGANGAGATAMGKTFKLRDLRAEEVQKMTDAQLSDIVAKGKGKMSAYEKKLAGGRIHAVVGYIRDLAKKK